MPSQPDWGKVGAIAAVGFGVPMLALAILSYVRPPDPNHPMKFDFLTQTISMPLWLTISAVIVVPLASIVITKRLSSGRVKLVAKAIELEKRLGDERQSGEHWRMRLQELQREVSNRDGRIANLESELSAREATAEDYVRDLISALRTQTQTPAIEADRGTGVPSNAAEDAGTKDGELTNDGQRVNEEIQFMTANEREIIAYLLAHNQKMFTNTPDCGHASTLVSKGIVVPAVREGQPFSYHEMPFRIPDKIWSILKQHQEEVPYDPEAEPDPWRRSWME